MRLFRCCILSLLPLALLHIPAGLADSYDDWPNWNDWRIAAKKTCNSKSNTGKDQVIYHNCMAELLLRDFPLPAGLAEQCLTQVPTDAPTKEQAQLRHKCANKLIMENARIKEKVARNLQQYPVQLTPLLKQCEEAYVTSGVEFAKKWQYIETCLQKAWQ